jgi:hypothetical protein
MKWHGRHHSKNIYAKSTLRGWCQDSQGMSWGRILYHACDKELVSGNQCDSESDHGCLESELRKRSDPFGAPVVYSA